MNAHGFDTSSLPHQKLHEAEECNLDKWQHPLHHTSPPRTSDEHPNKNEWSKQIHQPFHSMHAQDWRSELKLRITRFNLPKWCWTCRRKDMGRCTSEVHHHTACPQFPLRRRCPTWLISAIAYFLPLSLINLLLRNDRRNFERLKCRPVCSLAVI